MLATVLIVLAVLLLAAVIYYVVRSRSKAKTTRTDSPTLGEQWHDSETKSSGDFAGFGEMSSPDSSRGYVPAPRDSKREPGTTTRPMPEEARRRYYGETDSTSPVIVPVDYGQTSVPDMPNTYTQPTTSFNDDTPRDSSGGNDFVGNSDTPTSSSGGGDYSSPTSYDSSPYNSDTTSYSDPGSSSSGGGDF